MNSSLAPPTFAASLLHLFSINKQTFNRGTALGPFEQTVFSWLVFRYKPHLRTDLSFTQSQAWFICKYIYF